MAAFWRSIERLLKRRMTADQAAAMVGDLHEDFARRRPRGFLQAFGWLARECASVLRAYRGYSRVPVASGPNPGSSRWLPVHDELRLASRRLMKRPAASTASVLALASGIAAAAVAWSLLSAVLLRPLAVSSPETLMVVDGKYPGESASSRATFNHLYRSISSIRDTGAFDAVTAGGTWSFLVDENGVRETRSIYFTLANFFDVLGVRLQHGRSFAPDEDRRGAAPVVVLSDSYWRRHFNADPAVINQPMRVGEATATIVGVAATRFRGLNLAAWPDFYMPLHVVGDLGNTMTNFFAEGSHQSSPTGWITILGRTKPGIPDSQTTERINALVAVKGGITYSLQDVNTAAVPPAARDGVRGFGRLLGGTVGLLLLASGVTVGLLLLIRAEARRDELAMCLALGASRMRVAGGIAIEGALLAVGGALLAVPLAWWLVGSLRSYQLPGRVSIERLDLGLDWSLVAMAAAGAVAVAMLIALVAATAGLSANVADALRTRAGATPRVARRRTRSALIAAQVAVTLVLLSGATLFGRSLVAALRLNPGFDTTRIVTGFVSLPASAYPAPRATAFFDELRAKLDNSPEILFASLGQAPGGMGAGGRITIDGVPRQFPSTVSYVAVDERYFKAMGISVMKGRDFTTSDAPGAPLVNIVSESFGRMLAHGGDPVGRLITESSRRPGQPAAVGTVIGVVPDIVTDVAVLEPLVIYSAFAQRPSPSVRTLTIRASRDAATASGEMLAAIRSLDPSLAPAPFLTMEQRIARQMGPQQFGALVLGVLGGIAVLLTLLGAYVLAESMAAMRQREVGIRAALGATRASLNRLLLSETARLVGIGLGVGLAISWFGANTIRAFMYQVEPLDVTTLAGVSILILMLTLMVSLRPAVRTSRTDLARVLRED